jgi:hypothetical protein
MEAPHARRRALLLARHRRTYSPSSMGAFIIGEAPANVHGCLPVPPPGLARRAIFFPVGVVLVPLPAGVVILGPEVGWLQLDDGHVAAHGEAVVDEQAVAPPLQLLPPDELGVPEERILDVDAVAVRHLLEAGADEDAGVTGELVRRVAGDVEQAEPVLRTHVLLLVLVRRGEAQVEGDHGVGRVLGPVAAVRVQVQVL